MFIKANEDLLIYSEWNIDGERIIEGVTTPGPLTQAEAEVLFNQGGIDIQAIRINRHDLRDVEDVTEALTQSIPADDTIKANERSMSHPERFL